MKRSTIVAGAAWAACSLVARGARANDPLEQTTAPLAGPRSTTLALGKIESLPPDTDLRAAIDRTTLRDASVTERHFSCIEYVLAGLPTLTLGDGYRVTLRPGDAMWIPPLTTHEHGTASQENALTLVFSMRPAADRERTVPGSVALFRSDAIARPPVQRYYESLVSVALPAGFASAPVAVDAMQTVAIVAGRASIRVDDAEVRILEAGSAIYVPALHRYEFATGEGPATALVYSLFGESRR